MPPDLRRQIERSVEDGQKTVHAAIKRVQSQLDRTARQADLDKVLKRLESLSKQVQEAARAAASRTAARPSPKRATRKPAARKPATRKPAARKPATRRAAPRKTAPTRPAAKRRAASRSTVVRSVPPPPGAPEPGPLPERIDPGETST